MSHRVNISFYRQPIGTEDMPMTHEEALSLLWFLLGVTDKEAHKNKEKPFCWDFIPQRDGYYSLFFSSICEEDVTKVYQKAQACKEAFQYRGNLLTIVSATPIADYVYYDNHLRLTSSSGAYLVRHLYDPQKNRRHKVSINAVSDPESCGELIRNKLIHRCQLFKGEDVKPTDIRISYLKSATRRPYDTCDAFHTKMPLQCVTFKLEAPVPILDTALYGGIGSCTGSGFGMVMPS